MEMASVYCTGCGRANPWGARFCSHCGTSLALGTGERGTETTSIISLVGTELPEAEFGRDQIHAFGADWRMPNSKGSMSAIVEPCSQG